MDLKDFLKKNKWTQRKLAQELGVSSSHINQIIKSKNNPSLVLARKIEEITSGSVTMHDLIDPKAPSRYKVKRGGRDGKD